jgi:hypothetical protein
VKTTELGNTTTRPVGLVMPSDPRMASACRQRASTPVADSPDEPEAIRYDQHLGRAPHLNLDHVEIVATHAKHPAYGKCDRTTSASRSARSCGCPSIVPREFDGQPRRSTESAAATARAPGRGRVGIVQLVRITSRRLGRSMALWGLAADEHLVGVAADLAHPRPTVRS